MVELAGAFAGEHDFSAYAASDDRDAEGALKDRNRNVDHRAVDERHA